MAIVDTVTGEVVGYLDSDDKIVKNKAPAKSVGFVKMYQSVSSIKKELSNAEFVTLALMSDFISYKDNIPREGAHRNGKILKPIDVARKIGMDERNFRKVLSVLCAKGYVYKGVVPTEENGGGSVKAIAINPRIFSRGRATDKRICNLFV